MTVSTAPSSDPSTAVAERPVDGNPFDLSDDDAYAAWRAKKLAAYPVTDKDLIVRIADLADPQEHELPSLRDTCARFNMAIYQSPPESGKAELVSFAEHLGLRRLDGTLCTAPDRITELTVAEGGQAGEYIPYTDRPLSWHTDGYYNELSATVRAVVLHCRQAAVTGGVNELLDHEIAYIRLRDANPSYIEALQRPGALTIPANTTGGEVIRAAQTGPVFSVSDGHLHMRFTARKRYAEWADDPMTAAARSHLMAVLEGGDPMIVRHRLQPGQGLICNNVLHNRSGFTDDESADRQRLIYRARYYDRISANNGNAEGAAVK